MKVYICSEQRGNMYACTTESMAKAWLLDRIFENEADKDAWRERFDSEDPDAYHWDSCSASDAFDICRDFTDYWLDICELHCSDEKLPQPRIEEILPSERLRGLPDDLRPVMANERTFVSKPVGKIMHRI